MSIDPRSVEYPAHVVAIHSRGTICSGEVWNQFVDSATPDALGEWMARLTPELERYFRHYATEADFARCRGEQERSALRLLIDWYDKHAT
jgi:hypothetical protein